MKDVLKIIFMICILVIVYIYRIEISDFIIEEIIYKGSNKLLTYNEYYMDNDFMFVQNIESNSVSNYNEMLNMIYTIINSGDDSYSFYCDYDSCIDDAKRLTSANDETIANINNFVHPFNSFSTVSVNIANSGKITIKSKKNYTDIQIQYIKDYIDKFINENITNNMSDYEKIRKFHDYVINTTEYDTDNVGSTHNAYNLIISGKSICNGYSDIMAIYLNTIGVLNYRVTSENHIWNLVYLNGKWSHIDVTWDDPVVSDGNQYLIHNFFMISTEELLNLDRVEHNFNKKIYLEAK